MSVSGLSDYVQQLTELVSNESDPCELVAKLMPLKEQLLQCEDLIPDSFLEPRDDAAYTRNLLYGDPEGRFVVMALVWKAGAETPAHDHSTWGVVGCYKNSMDVVNFAEPCEEGGALEVCGRGDLDSGNVVGVVPPRKKNLHIMRNSSDRPTVTIHTYGDPADSCRIYCRETGKQNDVSLAFHQTL